MSSEVFKFLYATSPGSIPKLLDDLAANHEIDALISAASCVDLFLVGKEEFNLSIFAHKKVHEMIKKLTVLGSRAYPFIERMVDLSLIGETREEKINSGTKLIEFFVGDDDTTVFKVMIKRAEQTFPDFIFEITESQSRDKPASLAATMIRKSSNLSELLTTDMAVLPLVYGDMNLLEYAAINNSAEMVDSILVKCKNLEDALTKMGEQVVTLLTSTPELSLQDRTVAGQNLTRSAIKMIAAGAALTEEQWKAIVELTIRPHHDTEPFKLPYIVARYIEPSYAGVFLTRMIKEGGISPDWKLHNNTTLLHAAVKSGYLEIVNAVLNAGADPTLVDRKKRTPADVARERSEPEMIRFLDAASAKFAMMKIINAANVANATNATNAAKKANLP
jgi:hypothetical protein